MNTVVRACSAFLLVLVAFVLQIFLFSPISSPNVLDLGPLISPSLPTNNQLQKVIKLGEGFFPGPEDVIVDKEGVLYTATRDGCIKRMYRNGSLENWKKIDSEALLGLAFSKDGGIIVCDAEEGLLRVDEDGVTVVASHMNGSKIRFADEVIESSDGSLYFSIPSTKFGLNNWYLDVLEARPYGQILKYDPVSKETSILVDGLAFANGVALSSEEDFLVFCETWKFRCIKYWLQGRNQGKTEIFVDNLPGGPDNINLAPDGSFWIGLLKLADDGLEFVHKSTVVKYLVAPFPKLVKSLNGATKKATVINVAADGKIIRKFDDPDGSVVSFVTSAFEFEDHLYLGSLNVDFVGKFPLKST